MKLPLPRLNNPLLFREYYFIGNSLIAKKFPESVILAEMKKVESRFLQLEKELLEKNNLHFLQLQQMSKPISSLFNHNKIFIGGQRHMAIATNFE